MHNSKKIENPSRITKISDNSQKAARIVGQFSLTRKRLGISDITGNAVLKQIFCIEKTKKDYLPS